jgi:high affinity sulfate transporter 1
VTQRPGGDDPDEDADATANTAGVQSQPADVEYAGDRPSPFTSESLKKAPRPSLLPILVDLRSYTRMRLRTDVLAGVAIAALAVPQAMAYAQTAGLPVAAGLYGLLVPLVAYAALGSSQVLMTGPTATAALLVAPALLTVSTDPASYPALGAMLALLVGVVFLAARLLRLGWISNYFSTAVLLGFLTGLGLTLIFGQLGVFTGVSVDGDTPLQEFLSFIANVVGGTDPATLTIGIVTLVALLVGGRYLPKFPMLLLVTVGAIAVSAALDLGSHGVVLVGQIPAGLPSLAWPGVSVRDVLVLIPSAVGIALVAFADAVLTARSVAGPKDRPVDANQELIALAGLNVAAGLSQSFPLGASGSRSAVNVRLGGRTQVVSLVQAAGAALVLLFLTGALALLPKATLAAVIIYAAIGLIDIGGWKGLARGSRGELLIAAVVVVGMLTIGLLPSLVLAVLMSIIDVVRRSAQPRDAVLGWSVQDRRFVDVERRPHARVVPGIVVYRLDDRLFFANSRYFLTRVREAIDAAPYAVTAFVFDAECVTNLDASAAEALVELIDELRGNGVRFVLARSRSAFDEEASRFGLDEALPPENRFPTVRAAVSAVSGTDIEAPE